MNESAGIALKRHLGLMAFPIVKYARLIGVGGLKVYFVFFDSRMPQAVFTTWQTFDREFPTAVAFAHKGTRLNMTPLVPIEEWKGTEQDSLFIRVNMSGRFAEPKSYGMYESTSGALIENLTLDDFKNPDAIDAMTQKFRTIRRKRLGMETMRVKLVNVRWSTARDWVEFAFKSMSTPNAALPKGTTPTTKGQGAWPPKKRTSPSPSAHFALVPNKPKVYNLLIRLDKFFTWMLDTLPDGQQLTMKDISDAIKVCPVRFWSDCPAWHWQGLNYNMSQMGCSLRPTNIAPQFWNQPHLHGPSGMLDKHLGALVRNISFFTNQISFCEQGRAKF